MYVLTKWGKVSWHRNKESSDQFNQNVSVFLPVNFLCKMTLLVSKFGSSSKQHIGPKMRWL